MPLEQVERPLGTDPFTRKLSIVYLDDTPADLLHCVARNRRAKRLCEQLPAEAVTDDWHTALIIAQRSDLFFYPRQVVICAHAAAERTDA